MEKIRAVILLLIFSAFFTGSLVPTSFYGKLCGSQATMEDTHPASEEPKEDQHKVKYKEFAGGAAAFLSNVFGQSPALSLFHFFKLVENIYFEVPHSPPDLA